MRGKLPAPPPGLLPRRRDSVIDRVAGHPRRENAQRHQIRQHRPGHDTSLRHDQRSCTEPDAPAAETSKPGSTRQQAKRHWLLRERGTSGERRAQAAHPAKKKPELLAAGPDQVWSWDITKLKGPAPGIWYLLYVILDIYSRKVIHWEIWPTETGALAKEFIEHAIAANDGIKPRAVHADRGTSMTSNTVAGLYAKLNIAQSHSRPHVSDGNPCSEAQFKTLKYCPAFPGQFGSIQDANVFCDAFFTYYNTEHRHSGIAMHTPASVHDGTWAHVQASRAATLRAAYLTHPERFRGRCPQPKTLPTKVWINEPPSTIETSTSPQTTRAA